MEQLRYADEIRDIAEVPIPKVEVKKPELDLAIKLIDQAAIEDFDAKKYKDNVRERMMEQIERKSKARRSRRSRRKREDEGPRSDAGLETESRQCAGRRKGETGQAAQSRRQTLTEQRLELGRQLGAYASASCLKKMYASVQA